MAKEKKKEKSQGKLRILAAGDIHGSSDIAERLAEKAEKENVDLVLLLGDIHGGLKKTRGVISPFKKRNKKVLFIPGNWDTTQEATSLTENYGIRDLNGYYALYDKVGIIGVGNPDFQMSLDEAKVFNRLKGNFEKIKDKSDRRILISHLHAKGTIAEFSGIEGSTALRKAIDYFQPDFFLQAHIHEAEGIEEKIGKTKVINVGRRGRIIEL